MRFEVIRKPTLVRSAANVTDYERAYREFSWDDARAELAGLPGGRGLNIAHEAVDRHAAGARARHVAIRWLGKQGTRREMTYSELALESAREGIEADVIDLRCLRPLDLAPVLESVRRTKRLLVSDEGWTSGSLAGEVIARVSEQALFELDAAPARVCSVEVPVPYAAQLERAALPQAERIVMAAKVMVGRG